MPITDQAKHRAAEMTNKVRRERGFHPNGDVTPNSVVSSPEGEALARLLDRIM